MEAGAIATAALTRQAIALEVVKKAAEADQQVAGILEEAANSIAALTSRGTTVNISV
jgi:hypothetical protein